MRLTHNRNVKLYPYKLEGRLLESTKNHPYLGVCITDSLSWTAHINNITSSAYRALGFIKRNLYSCSKPIKQTAYLALVTPLLEYSNSIWDPHQKELINKIEIVQKRQPDLLQIHMIDPQASQLLSKTWNGTLCKTGGLQIDSQYYRKQDRAFFFLFVFVCLFVFVLFVCLFFF